MDRAGAGLEQRWVECLQGGPWRGCREPCLEVAAPGSRSSKGAFSLPTRCLVNRGICRACALLWSACPRRCGPAADREGHTYVVALNSSETVKNVVILNVTCKMSPHSYRFDSV